MAAPSQRKTAPSVPASSELLSVLVAQHVLRAEHVERIQRAQKLGGLSAEQAILQLGFASDVQIAQALAAHAGLPYVKINPLDLDLDVVTKAIAGPFARKHGIVAIGGQEHEQPSHLALILIDGDAVQPVHRNELIRYVSPPTDIKPRKPIAAYTHCPCS